MALVKVAVSDVGVPPLLVLPGVTLPTQLAELLQVEPPVPALLHVELEAFAGCPHIATAPVAKRITRKGNAHRRERFAIITTDATQFRA